MILFLPLVRPSILFGSSKVGPEWHNRSAEVFLDSDDDGTFQNLLESSK